MTNPAQTSLVRLSQGEESVPVAITELKEIRERHTDDSLSAVVRREWIDGNPYLNLDDVIYLCECSRDRFLIEGNPQASDAMGNLAHILSVVAIVV